MPVIASSRSLYSAQLGFRDQWKTELQSSIDRFTGRIVRYGEKVPQVESNKVLAAIGDDLERVFVGADYRSAFGADGVSPLATFPRILNFWLAWVSASVVFAHYTFMQRVTPPDLFQQLGGRVREQINPFVAYEAPHTWVDASGYTLSGRIWQAGIRTRGRMDAFLSERIRNGQGSLQMSRELERFLLPGRAPLRTKKPYGTDASFDAMRLARTEIARAHTEATFISSRLNPYVTGMDWALSAQHPKLDICDRLATIGMQGQRLKAPYPIDSAPHVVEDSHPQCLCNNRPAVTEDIDSVIERLRGQIGAGEPPLTPAQPFRLLRLMIGTYLVDLVRQEFQNAA